MKLLKSSLFHRTKSAEEARKAVFQLMESGWVLCVWRNSSPHNWFLEHPKTKEQIDLDRNFFDPSWTEKMGDSEEQVIQYLGSDSGMPVETKYVLCKQSYIQKIHRSAGGGCIFRIGWFESVRVNSKGEFPYKGDLSLREAQLLVVLNYLKAGRKSLSLALELFKVLGSDTYSIEPTQTFLRKKRIVRSERMSYIHAQILDHIFHYLLKELSKTRPIIETDCFFEVNDKTREEIEIDWKVGLAEKEGEKTYYDLEHR